MYILIHIYIYIYIYTYSQCARIAFPSGASSIHLIQNRVFFVYVDVDGNKTIVIQITQFQ